ncbi:MAG: hypothetical protein PHD72_02105 [Patescibacteria group bacterium]|nr:hypothetical protein [Patescibacteria group bacterium]
MKKEEAMKKEEINKKISSALHKGEIKQCLYPEHANCSKKIINAHSIQNNKVLSKISENGEVIMFSHDASQFSFNIKAKRVGRSSATTFTGFCEYHDKIIFQPIEDKPYRIGDLEQNALFAFRAFSKELHTKLSAPNVFEQYKDNKNVAANLLGNMAGRRDLEYCLDIFKKVLFGKEFNLIETKCVVLDQEFNLAISTGDTMNYDFVGSQVNNLNNFEERAREMFITIFPENGKTYILFSYLGEDREKFNFLDEQLINTDDVTFKIRLSNLITLGENLVISPSLWSRLGATNREIILDRFLKNIKEEDVPGELSKNYGFNLFI